jgi:hypothetical protein
MPLYSTEVTDKQFIGITTAFPVSVIGPREVFAQDVTNGLLTWEEI